MITALIFIALTNMTNIIEFFSESKCGKDKIAVIDETGELYPMFQAANENCQ